MNKDELAKTISDETGISKKNALRAVDTVFQAIGTAVANGETVRVSGFGIFCPKERCERIYRNPNSGASVVSPKTVIPTFRPAAALKALCNKKTE